MSEPQQASPIQLDQLGAQVVRLEALFEKVPLAMAVFDEGLTLVRSNARYRELTNLGEAQATGLPIYDAFPNTLADISEHIDAAIGGGGPPFRVVFQHVSAPRIVEAAFTPLGDEVGTRGFLFAATDVSEREELREDLARSIAQLAAIFDVIPESVRVYDAEGNIIRSNTQAQQDHTNIQPKTLRDIWQHDRPRTLSGTSLFLHEHPTARGLRGELVRGQMLAVRRGAEGVQTVLEVNSNPLRDAQGRIRGCVSVERDVTERTRLAAELEEQVRRSAALYERVSTEAERLERMVAVRTQEVLELQEARARERRLTAVGQLAAGVMHDVNNALNPIVAAAYLLDLNAEDPVAVRDYAARIARAAETGAATAARVGRFIRQDPLSDGREEIVDISQLVEEVVAMTRPLWAERARGGVIRLEQRLEPGMLALALPGEIREALLNLVHNALDAMSGGGTLRLQTSAIGDEVCIEVGDTGEGMSAEVRERAFEPFFTTKGHGGTGLGLAEVYGIMRRHRGRAEIDSAVDAGTTVRLCIPMASGERRTEPVRRAPVRERRRVLLVEDNLDGREFMEALLASDGHDVESVATVAAARSALEGGNGSPSFDVLLTDVGLPDGNGWDLVSWARTRWTSLRIGVVTGWEGGTGQGAGADFVLRKPVRTHELLAHIVGEV